MFGFLTAAMLTLGITGLGAPPASAQLSLDNPRLVKELQLTDEQVQKARDAIVKVQGKCRPEFAKLREVKPAERLAKQQELIDRMALDTEQALAAVFTAAQMKRLKQIELQAKGHGAFARTDVQQALKLTEAQKEKIAAIGRELLQATQETLRTAPDPKNLGEVTKKLAALQKAAMDKTIAILTDEQRRTWKELLGEPFALQ